MAFYNFQKYSPKFRMWLGYFLVMILFNGGSLSMQTCLAKGESEGFNSLRLPFGNPETRHDLIKVSLNEILGTHENRSLTSDEFFQELGKSDIILIGESHTNNQHHQLQKRVIEGLYERGFPVVIGLEMFNPSQNQALEEYILGLFPAEEFIDKTGWFKSWGHNFRYYRPIFEFSRDNRIPMYGVNIPHELVSKARKSGLASLSEEESRQIAPPDTANAEHRFLVNVMMQGVGAQSPETFAGIYLAQCLWDSAMGEGAFKLAQGFPKAKIVILVGTGHVAYNLGIARIIAARSALKTVSILPVDIPFKEDNVGGDRDKKPGKSDSMDKSVKRQFAVHLGHGADTPKIPHSIVSRGAADFFIGVPEEEHEEYPTLGLGLKDTPGGIAVSMIFPETLAEKKGFKMGDLIRRVNGESFASTIELKKRLSFLNWKDRPDFLIERDGKKLHLKFSLVPPDPQ